jgi:hypothetical protein
MDSQLNRIVSPENKSRFLKTTFVQLQTGSFLSEKEIFYCKQVLFSRKISSLPETVTFFLANSDISPLNNIILILKSTIFHEIITIPKNNKNILIENGFVLMKKLQVLRQTIPVFMRIIPVLAEKQFFKKITT